MVVPILANVLFILSSGPSLFGFEAEVNVKHMRRRGGLTVSVKKILFCTLERDNNKKLFDIDK